MDPEEVPREKSGASEAAAAVRRRPSASSAPRARGAGRHALVRRLWALAPPPRRGGGSWGSGRVPMGVPMGVPRR